MIQVALMGMQDLVLIMTQQITFHNLYKNLGGGMVALALWNRSCFITLITLAQYLSSRTHCEIVQGAQPFTDYRQVLQ